jgi:ABC-type transporter Mla subunit MlaD
MPSALERQRNNVKTGVFVSVAIIVGTAVVMTIGEVWVLFEGMKSYSAEFAIADGVQNIKSGGEVRGGGVKLGRVTEVRPRHEEDGPFEVVHVDFDLHKDVELFDGAKVYVRAPVIGAGAWLEITDVGDSTTAPLPEGTVIEGSVSAGQLESLLGADTAENVKGFADFLGTVEQRYEDDVKPSLDNIQDATAEAKTLVERVGKEDWPRWAEDVDKVTKWAADFTETIDKAAADAQHLLDEGNAMVDRNKDKVDETVEHVRAASENVEAISVKARDETMKQVEDLLGRGEEAMAEVQAAITRARDDYERWETDFSEALGSSNLAAQQLKFAMIEVRRSPWKVLYRPDASELEHEMLYESARSFALAVADVKAAAQSMQRVLDRHGDELAEDPELMQRVRDGLLDPLDRYEAAQQRLFDVLISEGGP